MAGLQHKIDFALIITATNANPNGDPLNGNLPRENSEGYGEISDVCIKRKIRNRLQDMGERIFVQSDDRCDDGFKSLKDRAEGNKEVMQAISKGDIKLACDTWIDVRSFGQVFAFKGNDTQKDADDDDDDFELEVQESPKKKGKGSKKGSGVSVPVRGPVSIRIATSVSPVEIVTMQITKSVNGEGEEVKSSDRMGNKSRVVFGMYVINGSINCQLAEKTGFSEADADKIKEALKTLFENDSSAARPEGSMEVCRLYWWKHAGKTSDYSSAKIHRSVHIKLKDGVSSPKSYQDYEITHAEIDGLKPEVIDLV